MADAYRLERQYNQDVSSTLRVTTTTDDTTLVTARNASYTLFLQKLHVEVTTGSASKTWTFEDSASTPVALVPSVDASAIAHFDFDFGPRGIPLTEGKNFVLNVSATGAAGWVSYEMYQRLSSPVAYTAGAAAQ